MVRFTDPEYTKLSRTRKIDLLDKKIDMASNKENDIDFKIELLEKYKQKLQAERTKLGA